MTQESIYRKIQKALKLSENNPNPEEAQTSLLLAQKLMAKHNISMAEVESAGDKTQREKEVTHEKASEHKKQATWKGQLARVIGENFRAHAYFEQWGRGSTIKFMGLKEDAELAAQMYKFAESVLEESVDKYMRKLRREARKNRGTGGHYVGTKNDYIYGFINGLEQKFKDQVEQEQMGLILVKDALVEQKMEEMNFKQKKRKPTPRDFNEQAYATGYKTGNNLEKDKYVN